MALRYWLTRRQWRCVVKFFIPLALLWICFGVKYLTLFLCTDSSDCNLLVYFSGLGMDMLWAYFPTVGAFAWVEDCWRSESTFARLFDPPREFSPRQQRFFVFTVPGLFALWLVTFVKQYAYLDGTTSSFAWGAGLALELIWIYLQGLNVVYWIVDNWRSESEKALESKELLSARQLRCLLAFCAPLLLLLISFCALHGGVLSGAGTGFRLVWNFIEDAFYVYFPAIGVLSWVLDNWHEEAAKLSFLRRMHEHRLERGEK